MMLRRATPSDIPALLRIEEAVGGHWFLETFQTELSLEWCHVVVAEDHAGLAGFVVYWNVAGEFEVMNVATHPSAQRRGVGRLLISHVLAEAERCGISRAMLEVRKSNGPARSLYCAMGFVEDGVRPAYYQPEGEDALLMEWRR